MQASLFVALRQSGFDARGEVAWKKGQVDGTRGAVCRFDIVIYKDGVASHIVEVKAAPIEHRNGVENTRQGRRYRQFGVPVTFVYGGKDAADFLEMMLASRG